MYIYKTTNKINGKIYIGQSKRKIETSKDYLGSGILIKLAIKKHGRNSFEKEILCECKTQEELNEQEKYFIKELNPHYNISPGGQEGWKSGNENPNSKNKKFGELNSFFGKKHSKETKEQIAETKRGKQIGSENPNWENHWTEEQRAKASIKQKENHEHLKGEANPSKRLEVRKVLSEGKLGLKNPNAKKWILINDNTGETYEINGGIKRKLVELGLTWPMFCGVPGKLRNKKRNLRLYWKETYESYKQSEDSNLLLV